MKIILSAIGLLFFSLSFSQDKIYFHNGTRRTVKITSASADSISYFTKKDSLRIRAIAKTELLFIKYADGTVEDPDTSFYSSFKPSWDDTIYSVRKNLITFDLLMPFSGLGLSYERFICKGRLGLKIPILFSELYGFISGSGLIFYPVKQKRNACFVGLLLITQHNLNTKPRLAMIEINGCETDLLNGITLTGGFRRQINKKLTMALTTDFGFKSGPMEKRIYGNGGINVGYRF